MTENSSTKILQVLLRKQDGARGPGADNGLIFLKLCTVVTVNMVGETWVIPLSDTKLALKNERRHLSS